MLFERFARAVPGALLAMVVFAALVWLFDIDVAVVREFPSGVPIPSLPGVPLSDALGLLGLAFASPEPPCRNMLYQAESG
jgi:MFS superfamily sulfate permease-like transporter